MSNKDKTILVSLAGKLPILGLFMDVRNTWMEHNAAEMKHKGTSSMIDSTDVTEQELEVLRGDAVGNKCLCSDKWIIKVLMSLCQTDEIDWTEELEEQLCILWDLSMEEEVVSQLMSYDFLKIVQNTLIIKDNPRLIEIILGIIGNVCCCSDGVVDTIGRDQKLAILILNCLTSNDSLILIQLLRILRSIAIKIHQNPQSDWIAHLTECAFFEDSIIFILKSSTNGDLLVAAIQLLESISDIRLPHKNNFLEKLFKIDNLIPALLESFTEVINLEETGYIETEFKFVRYWVALLLTITECDSFIFDNFVTDESFLKLMAIMHRILKPWKNSYHLFPISELSAEVISNSVQILLNFRSCGANVPPKIDHIIATMIFSLETKSDLEEESEPNQLITGLFDCLKEHWLYIIKLCTSEQIVEILRLCECKICEYLIALVQSNSEVKPEVLDKMKKVATAVKKSQKDT